MKILGALTFVVGLAFVSSFGLATFVLSSDIVTRATVLR